MRSALKVAMEKYGSVNAAINCAGIGIAVKTLSKQGPHPLDEFQRVLTVNGVGTFNVIRLAAEIMAAGNTLNASGEKGRDGFHNKRNTLHHRLLHFSFVLFFVRSDHQYSQRCCI